MLFDRTIGLFLQPMRPSLPYREILAAWLEARFEPAPCRQALEGILLAHRVPAGLFDPPAIERGGMAATDELLSGVYQDVDRYGLVVTRANQRAWYTLGPRAALPIFAELLRLATQTDDAAALRRRFAGRVDEALIDLLTTAAPGAPPGPRWPNADRPGLYRREHASVLIRSPGTSVLLDPLCLALGYFPPSLSAAPTNVGVERLDAVAITHTHDDHWHLPSVLRWAEDPAMPVIVPQVPMVSILSPEEPAATLRIAGQRAEDSPWGTTLTIGDMEIDVLPFFGEQPTRLPPGPRAELRNWGNCYRFNTPGFSALVLVDSGADPAGDMMQVVAQSVEQRGPVDVLLSCVQEFPSPFFGGVATECLTLPFSRLRELYEEFLTGRLPSTTAGPGGIPRLCQRSGARYFLPYANGFVALGRDSGIDWGLGPSEAAVVRFLGDRLRERGAATQATAWNAGDAAIFSAGALAIVPYGAA